LILSDYLDSREMRAVEMNSEYLGISRLQLMENAGAAIAGVVKERFDEKSSVTIVCGTGGNGGDGFVAARHLVSAGFKPKVLLLGRPENISSKETRINWESLQRMNLSVKIVPIGDSVEVGALKGDIIIDALTGTGVIGALTSPYKEMVKEINASQGFKISVDVPSGVEADTGETQGVAVKADLTITLHKAKIGFKNSEYIGQLLVKPIGIPPEAEIYSGPGDVYMASIKRLPEAHKGDFGRMLVIGGSEIYSGAPTLTAMGAYATGVDLVYVAAPDSVASTIANFSPSLITLKLKGSRLNTKNAGKLKNLYEKIDTVAMGPGLGLHQETLEAVNTIINDLEELEIPIVIDADALKAYPRRREISTEAVFTPHAKEFENLTGKKLVGDLNERGNRVRKEASKLRATILLKGNVDIISDGRNVRFNRTGNPGMTVGGTGDVLTGITAGFLAKGVPCLKAAVAAAFVNGVAGDIVRKKKGYHLLPTDLIERVPFVIEDALADRLKINS
jgi:NAD(P)H-hydrate epimerase